MGHKGELFEAMCVAAFASRDALAAWRSGSDLLPFLKKFISPNRSDTAPLIPYVP